MESKHNLQLVYKYNAIAHSFNAFAISSGERNKKNKIKEKYRA